VTGRARLRLLGAALVAALLGCAAGAEERDGVLQREAAGGADEAPTDAGGDALRPGETASDPHAERAGGSAPDEAPPGPPPRFEAPAAPAPTGRPAPRGALLAVVAVRHGVVERDPAVLYALDAHLGADRDLEGVVGLPGITGESVDLGDLAALAHEEGRRLLLVDVAPGRRGAVRDGYLVDTAEGELLWHRGAGPPPPASATPGLSGRVAAAFARLEAPR